MSNITKLGLTVVMATTGGLLYANYQGDAPVVVAAPVVAEKPVAAAPAVPPKLEAPTLERSVKTVALGWEYLGPGAMTAQSASFTAATSMAEIEAALAKGGGATGGADLAIVPLASYVASYEKLRALAPEIVFVVGWSRGREVLYAADAKELARAATSAKPIVVGATPGSPEAFMSLAVLDLEGVALSRVSFGDSHDAKLIATTRGRAPTARTKVLLTSAELPRLMPVVAIAPRGFVQAHAADLEAWGTTWLAGVSKLQADVPAAARTVAAMPGAPAPVALIESLGQVELANLHDNAIAMGLAGRGALTLDATFRLTWHAWRSVGVLTTPAPEVAPIAPTAVASLIRASTLTPAASTHVAAKPGKRGVLLVVPATMKDADAFIDRIGLVAGVFDRLTLRIAVDAGPKTAEQLVLRARERFGLSAAQLVVGKRVAGSSTASIEVLAQ